MTLDTLTSTTHRYLALPFHCLYLHSYTAQNNPSLVQVVVRYLCLCSIVLRSCQFLTVIYPFAVFSTIAQAALPHNQHSLQVVLQQPALSFAVAIAYSCICTVSSDPHRTVGIRRRV
jgi:hypothetical protein